MNTRKVCLFCWVLLLVSTVAHAKIIFSSERNGVKGAYVMDDDGSNQTPLIEGLDPFPQSWSPDGTQILFVRSVHRSDVLFLMDPDGTNIRQLTENDGSSIGKCSFSPDGNFIVYDRGWMENNNSKWSVEVLSIKTGKREVISDDLRVSCDWSPDGKHILFSDPLSPNRSSTIWLRGTETRTTMNGPKFVPKTLHIHQQSAIANLTKLTL